MEATKTNYQQAMDFLARFGLQYSARFAGWSCPPFCEPKGKYMTREHMHGPRWFITISRPGTSLGAPVLSFDFWSSYANSHGPDDKRHRWPSLCRDDRRPDGGIVPSAYDVLACASSDINVPDDFADFCGEYGYDVDSISAKRTHDACAAHAANLRAFFTEPEREALAEIQ